MNPSLEKIGAHVEQTPPPPKTPEAPESAEAQLARAKQLADAALQRVDAQESAQLGDVANTPEGLALLAQHKDEIQQLAAQTEAGLEGGGEQPPGPPEIPLSPTPEAGQKSIEERQVKPERAERARQMTVMLDEYLAQHTEVFTQNAVQEAKKKFEKNGKTWDEKAEAKVRAETRTRIDKAKEFFTVVDPDKRTETPLERMAAMYEGLKGPGDPAKQEDFKAAIQDHMREVMARAFDQHIENPEQYVSHGFDHTLNVADYTKEMLEGNPSIVEAMKKEYGLAEDEAKFMLEQVAVFHDFGYPLVGDRGKAVHGIAGADLVYSQHVQNIFNRLMTGPTANREKLNRHLRDAVMFHSADKVERKYSVKVETTRGEFLIGESKDILEVIQTFNDPAQNPEGTPRDITEIKVKDEATQKEIEALLEAARADTTRKVGEIPPVVKVTVMNAEFAGRTADLVSDKDKKLGLEFSEVDTSEAPLHAVIRLSDNMDMRSNRFSPLQREKAFQEFYYALGDQGPTSQVMMGLEVMTKADDKAGKKKEPQKTAAEVQTVFARLLEEQTKIGNVPAVSPEEIAGLKSSEDAATLWKNKVLESVFAAQPKRDPEVEGRIRGIALKQNSESIRHFGGCEAVDEIKFEMSKAGVPMVLVQVNRAKFEKLNAIQVNEQSLDRTGKPHDMIVGVGEYQVWRAKEAYASIRTGGKAVEVLVVDEGGKPVDLTIRLAQPTAKSANE